MLQINGVSLALGQPEVQILKDINFTLQPGQIGCLLGPSGCGKTTTLRLLAGFVTPSEGTVRLDDKTLVESSKGKTSQFIPSENRGIGMLFQDFALFPHLSVYDNIAFGLRHLSGNERKERVNRYLALTRLEAFQDRKPRELSGGQQQRVALARALAPHPKLLLMDEPFSSLDTDLRRQLSQEVYDILKQENMSALLVTHDQQEAMQMADVIGVMNNGRIHQWAPSYEVYHEPVNRFVANFIGHGHFVLGTANTKSNFETQFGQLECQCNCTWEENDKVDILIRPDDLMVAEEGKGTPAMVTKKSFQGAHSHYWLRLSDGTCLEAFFPSHQDFNVGDWIHLDVDAQHLVIFPHESIQAPENT
ncbi:MAG: iron ABC transporter ATP-binding protein [Gammaproteobacteria bacterium]|nr:iron ABC transporter ATP-binding protein [Gammaproteobacteria bacterium]HBF06826.1 iron ABC transporter ATP-binding protein [Gammaproteobacteria bacterium]|tara:strand:- start:18491 stop:19576 length:1086 start_codon:yes stop_codon:yes gene_type:complete